MHVLDANFHYLTSRDEQAPHLTLGPEQVSQYLSSNEMHTTKRDAMIFNLEQAQYLCVNLFDDSSTYLGCVYLTGSKPFSSGDLALSEYMARLMEKAIVRNPSILGSEQTTIKNALKNLVHEYPLTANQKWTLNLSKQGQRYVCISLHSANRLSRLPRDYISRAFEDVFPNSYAFPKENIIVCFVDVDGLRDKQGDYHAILNNRLRKFLADTSGIAGLSNSFADLYNARIALAQAEAAIENGLITTPETELFYFQTYALISMVINSTGSLPAEAYFSERLQNLIVHDKTASISYLETLRVFLRNSLSFSQTAEDLYIHRSTVVDRISRIERELKVDLKDSDTRLQLEIILKAMEIENMVKKARE